MASLIQPGFAIRRQGCRTGLEVDCGPTVDGFHACCPTSYTCPAGQYNVVCCPPGATDCTEKKLTQVPQPTCANATWDLFDNGGYFCCEHGLPGYNRSNTNGCASPNVSISGWIQFLSTVRVGVDPATIASSSSKLSSSTAPPASPTLPASSSSSSTSSSLPSPASQKSIGAPVGAIAGSVIGGIAALAFVVFFTWFCMRHRRRRTVAELHDEPFRPHEKHGDITYRSEAAGQPLHGVYEIESKVPSAELPAFGRPIELDGTGRMK